MRVGHGKSPAYDYGSNAWMVNRKAMCSEPTGSHKIHTDTGGYLKEIFLVPGVKY